MTYEPLALPEDGADPILPFTWKELPRFECEAGGYRSITAGAAWQTVLQDGTSISLCALSQRLTYGGVLAGLPLDDETRGLPIRSAREEAAAQFGVGPDRVCLLRPMLLRSVVRRRENGELKERVVDFLPPISCAACFYSSRLVSDNDADGSSAVVVWFQSSFGVPESGHVAGELQRLLWSDFAIDWNW